MRFWDVLTVDIKGPVEIIWNDSQRSCEEMGDKFDKAASLFKKSSSRGLILNLS